MTCEKCGYREETQKRFGREICNFCSKFAPDSEAEFLSYLDEKVDGEILETFRKFKSKNILEMQKKASQGKVVNRAPFGYKLIDKELIPSEQEKLQLQKIFMDFLEKQISLNQLSKQYGFSVNGLIKILKNFTYIGKVKFAGEISQGNHSPIISSDLFNKVQSKLELIQRK